MASDQREFSPMEASAVNEMAIETRIHDSERGDTEGFFLCIPTKSSLETLFKGLGLKETA